MKHVAYSVAVAAALITTVALAQPSPRDPSGPPSQPTDQTMPSERQMPSPSIPATPARTQADPSADQAQAEPAVQPDPSAATDAPTTPRTRLAAMVPPGMSTQEACTGFTSVTECVVSLHAAQNLGVAFGDLKARLTGGQRLAAAIHELKPDVNAQAEVLKAEQQAHADLTPKQG